MLELGDVSVTNIKTGTPVTQAVTRWTTDTISNVREKISRIINRFSLECMRVCLSFCGKGGGVRVWGGGGGGS